MKKQLLFLTIIFMVSFQFINAQCTRGGTFDSTGNPNTGTYPISGSANITVGSDGILRVNFENDFVSVQGFQLQVFLSTQQSLNMSSPSTFLRVDQDGDLVCDPHSSFERSHNEEAMTGAITFSEDLTGVSLNDYQYIILQCVEFNVPWGFVNLGAQSSGCSFSVNENSLKDVALYPNPSNGNVTLQAQVSEIAQISVYNILGNRVYQKAQSLNSEMNLSNLKTGIYLVKIEAEGKQTTKRLIIE